ECCFRICSRVYLQLLDKHFPVFKRNMIFLADDSKGNVVGFPAVFFLVQLQFTVQQFLILPLFFPPIREILTLVLGDKCFPLPRALALFSFSSLLLKIFLLLLLLLFLLASKGLWSPFGGA